MNRLTVAQAVQLLSAGDSPYAGQLLWIHITDGESTSEGKTPDYVHGVYTEEPSLELPEGQRVVRGSLEFLKAMQSYAGYTGSLRVDFEGAEAFRTDAGTSPEVPGTTEEQEPAL